MANSSTESNAVEDKKSKAKAGPSQLRLANYLGILRDEPFDADALEGLRGLIELPEGEERSARLGEHPVRLIEKARQGHEERGELLTVAHLLEAEAVLVSDDAAFAGKLWKELGRVRAESLLDADGAHAAYERALKLLPGDTELEEAMRRLEQEGKSAKKLIKRFDEEADAATEPRLKAALLTDVAALTWQYKKKGREQETEKLLRAALKADPSYARASQLLEHTLRERGALGPLADLLLESAESAGTPAEQAALYARAGRTIARDLKDAARAAACFERVNDLQPGNAEALAFLSEHFGKQERWDDLAALYEQTLATRPEPDVEQAILLQIGMTHFRMRGRADAAEPFFARLRRLDPAHPAMLEFYREHFAGSGRLEDWLAVLADAQRVATSDTQRAELALLAGRAALERPELRDRAIESFRLAQRLDPKNRAVSAALRELYLKAEKWNALADVIKGEIEATPDSAVDAKIGLLRELHAIYRDRLHMDGMVIGTLGRILKLSPGDQDALTELATKYESTGRFNELISILSDRADALTDPADKVDGYLRVARLWIDRFQNFNQATVPFEKVLEIDPNNREALSQLRGIYEKKRAWKQLYEVLRRERSVASDPSARLTTTIELAKLAADRLQSYAEAISLWKEALAMDAGAPGAIEALQKLAERDRDYTTLAELLEREVERAAGNEDKVRALQKLAMLRAEQLQDIEGSLASWRRILEVEPRHGRALRAVRDALLAARDFDGLTALYGRANDDEGLLDVLSNEADRVEDPKLKVALSFRAADVLEQRIKEPLRAVRSYERVLSVEPGNVRAAAALAVVYEQEEKWGRLRAMLEIMLRATSDAAERVSLLNRLRELCLVHLREGDAALVYAAEAYKLAPDDAGVREALEKAAAAAAGWDTVVELYSERARSADEDSALELRRRAASIALGNLGKPALAAEQLRFVLAQRPDDIEVMGTLERIYRGAQDVMALHTLLEHRLQHVPDEGIRVATLRELAEIEENVGGDADGAASRLRALTELRPDDREALAGLDRLALAAERYEELADVLERRIAIEGDKTQQVELGTRVGMVWLDKLKQPERAVAAFEGVLERENTHAGAVNALERIAEQHEELAPRVRPTLELVYERTARYDKLLKLLEKRLASEKDDQETRRLRLRIAEISAGQLGDAAGAYGALEAAFFEQPSDRELWDKLADAAEAAGQQRSLGAAYGTVIEAGDLGEDARIELAIRAAKLFDEVLGLPEEAEPLHKRVLASDTQNDRSFIALKELYTSAERWDDLQVLYRKRIEDTLDAETKLELLSQLCFLFEEILDRPDRAIETYEQILVLDPAHAVARRTLERLYERSQRYRELAQLLTGNLDQAADKERGQERIDVMLKLGDLYENKLAEPGSAVDQYEGVLADQPLHMRAQQALARLLSVTSQRQRIAEILAPLYETQGAYAELANVLSIRLESMETDAERAALSLRIGELHEHRTRDMDAALSAYAAAVEADPGLESARIALRDLAATRETFRQRRAAVLRAAVDKITGKDPAVEADVLLELAVLLDEYLADQDGAARAYERLIELDPDNGDVVLIAARALERIHTARGDHPKLAVDLRRQVDLESDPATRARLMARLAGLLEDTLHDAPGAIAVHRLRLEHDSGDTGAMLALERLYEGQGQHRELVDVLKLHAEHTRDDEERRALTRRAAALLDDKLSEPAAAIELCRDVVASLGPDRETLALLAGLYERAERHADLLDTLIELERFMTESAARAELQLKVAELLRTQLDDAPRSLGYYESVLQYDSQNAQALSALEALMASEDPDLVVRAARIAIPRYESGAAFEKLISALLALEHAESDPAEKLTALRRASEVAENAAGDNARAFEYMARAVRVGQQDPSLRTLASELARLAESGHRFPQYVELLQEITPEVYDLELKSELYRRIAEAAEHKLSDPRLALAQYAKLLEEVPEDDAALSASIRINEQLGDHRALLELLARKGELSKDPQERERIVFSRAALLEREIGDREGAVAVLEELIVERPVPAAFAGLERLLTALDRNEDLAALYEQQLDREIGSPLDARYKLAKLSLDRLSDTPRAIEHLRDALTDDPNHGPSIELLEKIMEQPGESRAVAAEILESGYLARQQWHKLVAALEARVEGESDPDERKRLLVRLGQLHEDQLEDFDAATGVYARLFREDPTAEDTWETLGRLAKVGGKWDQLVEILALPVEKGGGEELARLAKHVGRIAVDKLGAHERAGKLFAHALAADPTDREAFIALEAAHRACQAWDKLLPLYRRQADDAADDAARAALLHKLAEGQRELQHDRAAAIATYRELIELRSDDTVAVRALEALLVEAEDWQALAEHLRERVDLALGTAEELPLKLRLAELLENKLDDTTGAIDVLEDVVRLSPRDKRAIQVLERLVADASFTPRVTSILEPIYREQGEWKKLVAVLEAQVELSEDVDERARLLGEIGELHEQRGRDTGHALRAWSRALMVDPGSDAARAHVERLASARGAWDELVAVYEAVLAKLEDDTIATTMLATLARVHDEKRGDPRSAIGAYERLATLDPDDPAPLDSLESLHLMVGDWSGLAGVLARRVDQAHSPQEKGELLRRLGSIHEEVLGDRAAAMAAYEKAVAEDDSDALAYEALDRLYTREKRAPELVTLLGRRIELADASEERINLGLRLGTLLDVSMRRLSDAIDTYRRVLDEDPTHVQALAALASLLEREGRFRELLEVLAQQRSVTEIPAQRVAFSFRAGDVLEKRLDEPEDAIERYAEALATDKTHAPSIDALMRLGKSEQHRIRVREILEPLLREQERWDEVIALLETGLPHIDDPHERRTELQRIAETHEGGRHDNAAAFAALRRALAEDPSDDGIADDLERLSRMIGDFAPLADVLAEQGVRAADPNAGARLYRRMARICEQELRDDARAIEALVHASERDDDSIETLVDLDRLYEKTARYEELRDVIERRVAMTVELAERSQLLIRLGNLRQERFDDGRGALMAFREVLESEPGNEAALAGLERLGHREALALEVLELLDECYRNTQSTAKLAGLYDLRIKLAQTDGERIRLLREAAIIWERDLGDPVRALSQLRRVFEIDSSDDDTLLAIESLASDTGSWESLRGLVEGLVTSSTIEGQRKRELCLRAAEWYRDKLHDPAEERCVRWAIEVDTTDVALRERLVGLLQASGRERDRALALREWADIESSPDRRKELLRDAAALYETAASDLEGAAACWNALLDADPQDVAALAELERIRTQQGRPRDVAALIERRLVLATDAGEEDTLRYRLAETQRALGDDAAAIATLRALLQRVPGHPAALDALDEMYTRAERHEDLRALLRTRLETTDDFETRTALRLRLAALAETRFADRADAIALLKAVIDESPGHATADPELERLYTAEGRTAERVLLLSRRAEAAKTRGDLVGEVAALRSAADLYERELSDLASAARMLEGVRSLEPHDRETLEALARLYESLEQWAPAAERLGELSALETGDHALSIAHRIAGIAESKLADVELAEAALLRGHSIDPAHELTTRSIAALYERHAMHDKLAAWLLAQEPQVSDPTKKLGLLLRIAGLQRAQLGDAGAAANTLERAIALAPDDRDVLMQLCDLYIVAGRSKDAIPLLEKIVASYAGRRAKEVALYEHKLGQAYEGLGENEQALKHYDAAFKVDLTSVPILRDLGRMCLTTNDLERAQKTYRALLLQRLTPEMGITKADVYYRLGEISFKQGDKLKAKSMLERAVAEGNGHAEASALLAQC